MFIKLYSISEVYKITSGFISDITYVDVRGKIHSKVTTGERANSIVGNIKIELGI